MSRPPRLTYAGALHHVTLRCNNREFLFSEPSFVKFLDVVRRAREKFPIALYDYCLMTNHVHLLFEAGRDDTLARSMHWLGTTFVREFNKAAGRKGHLWEGRYRSTVVEAPSYLFQAMAYVDLNPVRAGMVTAPADYPWCGHRKYMALLAEEASRPPQSLATTYFVGSRRFVRRMEKRFGLDAPGRSVERRSLGAGVVACGPRLGDPGRRR